MDPAQYGTLGSGRAAEYRLSKAHKHFWAESALYLGRESPLKKRLAYWNERIVPCGALWTESGGGLVGVVSPSRPEGEEFVLEAGLPAPPYAGTDNLLSALWPRARNAVQRPRALALDDLVPPASRGGFREAAPVVDGSTALSLLMVPASFLWRDDAGWRVAQRRG